MSPGIVAESDLTGSLKSEYVFFNGKRIARKDFPGNAVSYYFSDDLNTAHVLTDSAGNIKEDEDFFPFGGELPFVNNDPNKYKFGGHELDGETGLYYYGARHYETALSRFMTPDLSEDAVPLPFAELNDPQTFNLYSYTRNNPLRFADPDGHDYHVCGPDGGHCSDLTEDQYNQWRKDNPDVKQSAGGTLENCGASGCTKIGSATWFDPQKEKSDAAGLALLALTSRVTDRYIGTPLVTFLSFAVPGALVTTMPEASTGIGVAIIAAGTKQAAKAAVEDAAITAAQKAAVKRAIARATTKETVSVERLADGSVRVLLKRPGANGFQVVSKVVTTEGETKTVQIGVEASGEVSHYDPKN